jgi:hypothetical protein
MTNFNSSEFLINNKSIPTADSSEYEAFWENEDKKITEGVTINGFYFSPFIYWHLNYASLYLDIQQGKRVIRQLGRPQLWDTYFEIDDAIIKAETHEEGKKGVVIVGSRRISKTMLTSSYIAHKAITLKGGDHLISALNQPDLNNTTQAVDLTLRNLPEYFRFPRIEDDWKRQVTLGYKDKKTNQRHEWSKIHVRNFNEGNNTEAAAGLTLSSFMLEEAGKGDMLACLAATIPCFDSPYGWRCSPIVIGTSGDMTKAGDLEELFNNPEAYNFLPVEVNETGKSYGLFVPGTKSLKVPKEPIPLGLHLEKEEPSELDNITIWIADEQKGKDQILKTREQTKKSSGLEAYLKEVMYYPLTHEECFLELSQNIFPVDLLQDQLTKLVNQNIKADNVELYMDVDGRVRHKFTDKKPVENFPTKPSDNTEGCIQIWEYPVLDAPYGLYSAGCLTPGEKVMTDSGLKDVEAINYSDKLINQDGKFVQIEKLLSHDVENENTYKVKVSNTFRTTRFTSEHPIYVSDPVYTPNKTLNVSEFNFDYVTADKIKVGQWIKVPNIYRKSNQVDFLSYWKNEGFRIDRQIENPLNDKDFWWFVGLYLGDGYALKKSGKLSISININEVEYKNRLVDVVRRLFDRSVSIRERKNVLECNFKFKQLAGFLHSYFGQYSEGKILPEWVKYLNEEFKLQLIQGYLNSDGCITQHTKGYYGTEFVSINLEMLEGFQDILFSLGIVSNLSKMRDAKRYAITVKECDIKECYHLRIGHSGTLTLKQKLNDSKDHKLNRIDDSITFGSRRNKGCFISEDLDYIYFQIKEICVSQYTGPVYNFECETNTFMCHHITTHNCDPYKQSQAHYSTSLGSTYIYKRVHGLSGEGWQNIVVASYTGRPKKIETWYENTKLLLKYYNSKALVENMDYGFIQHCIDKNEAPKLLERTPTFLNDIHPNSTVNRDYGIHMTKDIKNYLLSLIIEYITEVIEIERDDQGNIVKERLGVSRILDPLLLKELIKFTPKLNVDRVVSFGLTLAMAKSLNNQVMIGNNDTDTRMKEYFRSSKKPSLFRQTRSPFKYN